MKNYSKLLFIVVFASCSQNKTEEVPAAPVQKSVVLEQTVLSDSVIDKSFTAANGEKFLRLELVLNKSLEETWKYFATEEGTKVWMAPVVKIDLRIGGMTQTNYDSTAKIGDKGTISLPILNYIPNELITYRVELNNAFPKKCRDEDQNLQEVIKLESVNENQTKIISTMVGWGEGKEWNDTYAFFKKGNKWTFEQILLKVK